MLDLLHVPTQDGRLQLRVLLTDLCRNQRDRIELKSYCVRDTVRLCVFVTLLQYVTWSLCVCVRACVCVHVRVHVRVRV